jgi:hypothetical protein
MFRLVLAEVGEPKEASSSTRATNPVEFNGEASDAKYPDGATLTFSKGSASAAPNYPRNVRICRQSTVGKQQHKLRKQRKGGGGGASAELVGVGLQAATEEEW